MLYKFDGGLGLQPSFAVGQLVLRSRWLTRIALVSYFALPIAVMLVYAKQLALRGKAATAVFLGFFVVGPIGVILYNLLPACGPIYLFGSKFPFEPLSNRQLNEKLASPAFISCVRNAFPSLHVAWALLAWWYGEGLSYSMKIFLLLFLACTVLATLGLGEHYFVDLAAAFPFTLMIYAGVYAAYPWLDRRRLVPLLNGTLLLLGWIALLRFGQRVVWFPPLVPWTLIAFAIVWCLALESKLEGLPKSFRKS